MQDTDLLLRLEVAQTSARNSRVGMYRFGDVGDSDDEKPLAGKR